MRLARVVGKVVLNRKLDEVPAGSFLVVAPQDRHALHGDSPSRDESVVLYDNLAAREGDLVGLVEGREATAPFYPDKVPFDAYNACILDRVDYDPVLPTNLTGTLKPNNKRGRV